MGKVFKALSRAEQNDAPELVESSVTAAPPEKTLRSLVDEPHVQVQPVTETSKLIHQTSGLEHALQKVDERLVTLTQSSSSVAENFRRLRNKILHPPQGEPSRTILVTSVLPEEGKSFICANLAIIMAQGIEQHALIVEGDLRRPTLAKLFGLKNDRGLVNFLQDGQDISSLILETGYKKLSMIPSGPPPINPAELLDSKKMSEIINELSKRYHDRFIIIDSPPLSAASEIAVLAKYVDGVILVVRWGRARKEQVKQLVDLIGKEKILGVVFNAFEKNMLQSKMHKYYQDYYYYASDN